MTTHGEDGTHGTEAPDPRPPAGDRRVPPPPTRRLDRIADRLVDVAIGIAVVGFALWTVVFHLAIATGLRADLATALWLVLAGVAVAVVRRLPATSRIAPTRSATAVDPILAALLGSLALALAVVVGFFRLEGLAWIAFWLVVLALGGSATFAVLRGRPLRPTPSVGGGVIVVFAAAAFLAVLTAGGRFWNPDDVILVNRSVVVEHGAGATFPTADTLFSDGEFTYSRPDDPPSSIEPLIGVVARALPFPTATVAYLLVAPLAAALVVLGIYRLLRAVRAPTAVHATLIATGFLVLAGDPVRSAATGLVSMHQGKFILGLFVLPVLWAAALEWGRDGGPRALLLLIAAGIAGVGLSSSGLFLVPPVVVAGCGAGILAAPADRRNRALLGTTAALAYPLACGAFALSASRPGPGPIAGGSGVMLVGTLVARGAGLLDPTDTPAAAWWTTIGAGPTAALATAAVLTAWLWVRDRGGRLLFLAAPLIVFGFLLAPPVYGFLSDTRGAEILMYRVLWVLPIPAAVGLLLSAPLVGRRTPTGPLLSITACLVAAILLTAGGDPVTGIFREWTLRPAPWDVPGITEARARGLVAVAGGTGTVAAPLGTEETIAVTAARVRGVNPRPRDTIAFAAVPEFHAAERILVSEALTAAAAPPGFDPDRFVAALDTLGVEALCVFAELRPASWSTMLRDAGFVEAGGAAGCSYWRRDPPPGPTTDS